MALSFGDLRGLFKDRHSQGWLCLAYRKYSLRVLKNLPESLKRNLSGGLNQRH
jgi:hypothetical protein